MRTFKFVLILTLFISGLSWAGSNRDAEATFSPERIIKFAKDVEKYAAAQGAHAFIISRIGRPEADLPKGIHFTHTAVAVYSNITLDSGEVVRGYAIHNLYQQNDKPEQSQLIMDYPVDFFWGAQALKAGIVIPTPDIQQRLIKLIEQGKNKDLHNNRYSVIANPFNQQFQNCTEHTLDMLNAAIYQTTDIKKIKANTRAYFAPQRVHTSRFKLMFGSWLMDEVTTRDHKGKIATTTFMSIHRYLDQYELASHAVTLTEDGKAQAL